MNKFLRKFIPSMKSMKHSRQLKSLRPYFKAVPFWSREKQPIARGIAAGLAGAVIPGFQIFYATFLAIVLRGNLPVALISTFITNPLTFVPITYFIYYIGTLFVKDDRTNFVIQKFVWDYSSLQAFWHNVSAWILQFGKAYFVGLPFVSLGLGLIGYFGTILIWDASIFLSHKKKKR
jgi:uncharacterized protein (DUF2062 family)